MTTTAQDIQTALANEARRASLTAKSTQLQGVIDTTDAISNTINSLKYNAQQQKAGIDATLVSIVSANGPGITADFGPKSTIDQFLEAERVAAKSATIDFIKATPACTEQQAADTWNQAALASHPDLDRVVQDGLAISKLYQRSLASKLLIITPTWEAQRDWIINTPKDVIMAY